MSESFSQGLLQQSGSETQKFYPGSRASGRTWDCDLSPGHRCYSHCIKKVTEAGGDDFMRWSPYHVEAFLMVRSSVRGKGAGGGRQPFQSPHPSHCGRLRCWSSWGLHPHPRLVEETSLTPAAETEDNKSHTACWRSPRWIGHKNDSLLKKQKKTKNKHKIRKIYL